MRYTGEESGVHHVRLRVIDGQGGEAFSVRQEVDLGPPGEASSSIVPLRLVFDARVGDYEVRGFLDRDTKILDTWPLWVKPAPVATEE